MSDLTDAIRERVASAYESGTPLEIQGGGSKTFLGNPVEGAVLQTTEHCGIIDYQPAELVISARAGTPLAEIESALAEHNQMLAFEPPHFAAGATLGGCIATGLSGPRRPYAGAARDFVLGMRIINGRGEALRFGGEVMKNVAGYDVSRLITGSMGSLGVIMDVSLKVLPKPAAGASIARAATQTEAIEIMNQLAGQPWPLSGAYWESGRMVLRFSGAQQAVAQAMDKTDGDALDDAKFWTQVRELKRPFFADAQHLWRLSLPPATPPLDIDRDTVIDWGGAQRWLKSELDADSLRALATAAGGHATLFRAPKNDNSAPRFQALDDALMAIHKRVKSALDPAGILNPGRLYLDL